MQGARSSDENVNVHGIAHLFSLHVTLAVPSGPALARLACTPMTQMWLEKLEWAATCEVSERTLRHHPLKLVHLPINPPAKTSQATLKKASFMERCAYLARIDQPVRLLQAVQRVLRLP